LKVTNIVIRIPTKLEKSFGKNVKRPPSRIVLLSSTKRTTRNRTTKTTMERLRPSWDS
jgi:hypothetical protein